MLWGGTTLDTACFNVFDGERIFYDNSIGSFYFYTNNGYGPKQTINGSVEADDQYIMNFDFYETNNKTYIITITHIDAPLCSKISIYEYNKVNYSIGKKVVEIPVPYKAGGVDINGSEMLLSFSPKRGNSSEEDQPIDPIDRIISIDINSLIIQAENRTSTNSPYADNYNRLINGQDINGESFKHLSQYIYKDNSAVIPGIEQTNMGDGTACGNMVSQGVCIAGDYMLISAYCSDKSHNSVIYVLDKNTKKYITTLVLKESKIDEPHIGHVGALEYHDGVLYIADSGKEDENNKNDGDYRVWKISMSDIERAVNKGLDAESIDIIDALNTDPLEHKPSFIEIYKGNLYVGTFSEKNDNNKVYVYDLNTGDYKGIELSLNAGKVQGLSFFEKDGQTYCAVSSSYGRNNLSTLYISKCSEKNGVITEVEKSFRQLILPNMSEDIDISGDELFVSFESGAKEYATAGAEPKRPLDRVISLNLNKIIEVSYPVIVVPGIMGSNLYQGNNKVWAPSVNDLGVFLSTGKLKIDNQLTIKNYEDGKPIKQHIKEKNNREYGANGVYEELVDALCDQSGKPVYFFSYDWRQSNRESAEKLYEFIEAVKEAEEVDKVDIVAHSMGGIVSSYYASHKFGQESTEGEAQINKIITCATPYEGSPLLLEKALGQNVLKNVNSGFMDYVFMSGADWWLYVISGLKKDEKTKLPSMPELAPSERLYNKAPWFQQGNYFLNIEYMPTAENAAKAAGILGGSTVIPANYASDTISRQYSYQYAKDQLEGYDYNTLSYNDYASLCRRHFGGLYNSSRSVLSELDKDGYNYLRSMDNAYFIVGVNNYTPVSGAFDIGGNNIQKLIYESTGDGTVPYNSATMMKGLEGLKTSSGKRRFFTFTTGHGGAAGHVEEAGARAAVDCVLSVLGGGDNQYTDEVTGKKHTVLTIQCPVDVKIERDGELLNSDDDDFSGRASFGRLDLIGENGDVKSLCIDDEVFNVTLTGTGAGEMDLTLEWFDSDDNKVTEKQFIDIPITEKTVMHFETNKDGITTLYADSDGDGKDDSKWYADNGEIGYQLTSEISGGNSSGKDSEATETESKAEYKEDNNKTVVPVRQAAAASQAKSTGTVTKASNTGDTDFTALMITLSAVAAGIAAVVIIGYSRRKREG